MLHFLEAADEEEPDDSIEMIGSDDDDGDGSEVGSEQSRSDEGSVADSDESDNEELNAELKKAKAYFTKQKAVEEEKERLAQLASDVLENPEEKVPAPTSALQPSCLILMDVLSSTN